ncbi:MAG: TolC family protein [Romboutsia sp.]|nr:MAG: TolC family protein [Romboutsia sp.]
MKKLLLVLLILSLFINHLNANEKDLNIIQKDKKEYRLLEKESIQTRQQSQKYDWISPIDLSGNIGRNHSFSDENSRNLNNKNTKSASIGFTQSIFESGGIGFKMDYADNRFKYEMLSWENQNSQLIYTIYNTLLDIKKLKLEINQNEYRIVNKDIELIIKKIQYEAGKTDIIELNNAIMSKNLILKEEIALKNSLKEKEQELAKYTDLKYDEIEILDFQETNKEIFLDKNYSILEADAKVEMLNSEYKIKKSQYLPKLSLSAKASYSSQDEKFNSMINDTNKDDATSSGSLILSMPLYDYTKSSKIQESKIEVLKQKALVNDLKNETAFEYEQIFTKIDTYLKQNETINKNIKLYEELIGANKISSEAGMTSKYDLEILENTKTINEFDILINKINILQQYAKLYFKIKN